MIFQDKVKDTINNGEILKDSTEVFEQTVGKALTWWDEFLLKLPNMIVALITIVGFYFLAKLITNLLGKVLNNQIKNPSIRSIVLKAIFGGIVAVGFFIALGVLNLDKALTSLLAGAGVVALALGLALQSTLSNTFSGVMLSFLPRIKVGDYIETGSHGGFVDEISLRNIVLRQPDNHYVILPNSKFIEDAFVNYSLTKRGRITVNCGVAYGSDLRLVEEKVMEAMHKEFPLVMGESHEFYFLEFGDSSINFMTRLWIDYVKKSQMYEAQHRAILIINDILKENKVSIPFPMRTLEFTEGTMKAMQKNFGAQKED